MKNAFLLSDNIDEILRGRKSGVTEFDVATHFPHIFEAEKGVTVHKIVDTMDDIDYPRLVLLDYFENENIVDAVIERVLTKKSTLMIRACYSLDECGKVEVKTHLSPIQFLHKLGLLEETTIVGGVHLDKDDIDLMYQSKAKLVFCPTWSMANGYGTPPYMQAKNKLEIRLGSYDNTTNPNGDMCLESFALMLGTNSEMRSNLAITEKECLQLIAKNGSRLFDK